MNNALAYNTYAQNNVGIESPQKLIEMLYEGILRFNMQAKRSISLNDIEKRTYWINRSTAIFTELLHSLSFEGEGNVSDYLHGLYSHQLQMLGEANLENSAEKIDAINKVVKGLLEAWRESIALEVD
ncbi:MAG: flagellar protein FliS [Arcobacter sp.]|nr:MAG: flagellar protein FliS [Arcobacter sp.]